MSTVVEVQRDKPVTKLPKLLHAYCRCTDEAAICGYKPTRRPRWVHAPEDRRCVVCVDLLSYPCPRCGRSPRGLLPDD